VSEALVTGHLLLFYPTTVRKNVSDWNQKRGKELEKIMNLSLISNRTYEGSYRPKSLLQSLEKRKKRSARKKRVAIHPRIFTM